MPSKLAGMLHEHLFDLPGDPWSSAGYLFVKKQQNFEDSQFFIDKHPTQGCDETRYKKTR